jgi:hypothetical protein
MQAGINVLPLGAVSDMKANSCLISPSKKNGYNESNNNNPPICIWRAGIALSV